MMPWFIWLLAVMIVGYSMVGVVRRFFDRKRFDTTDDLRRLDPYQFERYIAEYYRRRAWLVTNRGGRAPDGGVDVVIENRTEKLLVQCKHWSAWKVGARPVRELAGLIRAERATGAILVTSGRFTKEAIDFARSANIELVDGSQLAKMIAEVRAPQAGALAPVAASPTSPRCPECGAELVLRTARRGSRAGDRFWGCSSFPTCRHTEPLVLEAAP